MVSMNMHIHIYIDLVYHLPRNNIYILYIGIYIYMHNTGILSSSKVVVVASNLKIRLVPLNACSAYTHTHTHTYKHIHTHYI